MLFLIIISLIVSVIMNHFIITSLFLNIELNHSVFYSIIISLFIVFILFSEEKLFKNKLISILHYICVYYLYLMIFIFYSYIITLLINYFFTINFFITHLIILLFMLSYSIYSSLRIDIKKIKLNAKIKKTKILHLSDLHITDIYAKLKIKRINNIIKKTKPDIIVMTGDLIDIPGPNKKDLFKIKSNCKILYVYGNHDKNVKNYKHCLSKFQNLNNKEFEINGINFKGYDDSNKSIELKSYKRKSNKYNILLYHRPNGFNYLKEKPDLMLCGHTHAGQIFPLNFLIKLFYKKIHGFHKINNFYVYISSGTTLFGSHFRFGTYNEAVLFEIG